MTTDPTTDATLIAEALVIRASRAFPLDQAINLVLDGLAPVADTATWRLVIDGHDATLHWARWGAEDKQWSLHADIGDARPMWQAPSAAAAVAMMRAHLDELALVVATLAEDAS
jgi:hypothetical protein